MTHHVLKSDNFFQTWPFKTLVFHWFNVKRRNRNWSQNTTVVNSESGWPRVVRRVFHRFGGPFILGEKGRTEKREECLRKGLFDKKRCQVFFFSVEPMFFLLLYFFSLVKFNQGFDKIHFTWSQKSYLLDQTTTSTTFRKRHDQNDINKQTPRGGFPPRNRNNLGLRWKGSRRLGAQCFFFQNGLS